MIDIRRRRFGSIGDAIDYSSMGRSKLYEKAAEKPGLFRKWDGKTLVDFDLLDQVLDELPAAEIKPVGKPRTAEPGQAA